jgi:hypothetical protein
MGARFAHGAFVVNAKQEGSCIAATLCSTPVCVTTRLCTQRGG